MDYRIGQIVDGVVTGIQPYGAFVSLDNEHQGLIHISETHFGYVKDLHDYLTVGQTVRTKILDIDEYSHKISLSLRCLAKTGEPHQSGGSIHKHYWTDRSVQTGFSPIASAMGEWLDEANRRF
ncbi:CvfD/Ygs/GSP13 family RNA-binding post-transcriptional regulator [Furfurilactobacillus curtus]|uniref:Polyribonucleotide nucleotidyltransferase n=1 Tax=Furfurilactobacillus curtus TaxID=1746200 RepID=A0ABQ5JSR5_9LACO